MTELLHDVSVVVQTDAVPWEALRLDGLPAGLEVRPLRRLGDGSVRSAIVKVPAGWSSDGWVRPQVAQQGLVLQGSLAIGEARLGPEHYFNHPAGGRIGPIRAEVETEVLWIFDGAQAFVPADPGPLADGTIESLDTAAVAWIESVIEGRPTGIKRKVLWLDPVTGADTRLLIVPPGFEGRGPNWHPINEEIYCLEGDIGPDDVRVMGPGTYLHNPAFGVHGYHEHSRGGARVLEWHDGQWILTFVEGDSPLAQPRPGGAGVPAGG